MGLLDTALCRMAQFPPASKRHVRADGPDANPAPSSPLAHLCRLSRPCPPPPPLQAAVLQALNWYAYADATFLAERLHAEAADDSSLYLLATCYYQSGQPERSFALLQGNTAPQCRYLCALSCLALDK